MFQIRVFRHLLHNWTNSLSLIQCKTYSRSFVSRFVIKFDGNKMEVEGLNHLLNLFQPVNNAVETEPNLEMVFVDTYQHHSLCIISKNTHWYIAMVTVRLPNETPPLARHNCQQTTQQSHMYNVHINIITVGHQAELRKCTSLYVSRLFDSLVHWSNSGSLISFPTPIYYCNVGRYHSIAIVGF